MGDDTSLPHENRQGAEDRREQPGLGDLFTRFVENLRAVAYAELDVLKISYALKAQAIKVAAIVLGLGLVLCLAGIIALLIGLIIALAPLVGPTLSALAVGGVVAGIGAILALAGVRKFASQFSLEDKGEDEPVLTEEADVRPAE